MPERKRRLTIRDVAREAGVSPATVSSWINGHQYGIAPATSDVVARTVERLGYRPSTLARGLRAHTSHAIGVIVASVANPSAAAIVRGAEDRASSAGYSLLLSNVDRHWERALELTQVMIDRGVDGIAYVFSVSGAAHPAVEAARQAGVRVGLILPLDDASSDGNTTVALDNRSAMHQAAELLWNLGHRRVAYAMTSLSTTNGWDRRIWLGAALEGHGVELTDDLVYVDPVIGGLDETDEIECGRRAAMVLLGRPNRPTAVCAGNDLIAIGLVRGARDLGLVVPKDISIVGFDDLAMASIVEPPLTTLAVPRYELGRAVVDRLVDESSAARPRVVVRPILVVRASTAEAPALPQPTFLRQP